nr:hypothetical protein [Rhizobium phaseoli]
MPISEGYALKYFVLYALVCSLVGIVLLAIIHHIAPFKIDGLSEQATAWPAGTSLTEPADQSATGSTDQLAAGPSEQPDDLVVRSTRKPATDQPAVQPPDQWDLRPSNQPVAGPFGQSGVRKGGRVGTPAE